MSAATEQRGPILLTSGYPVSFRLEQMIAWGLIVGTLGTCFVAGGYYGFWEVNWYVHIGPVHFEIFYLKPWWDKGSWWPSFLGHWAVYRHADFRDLLEPELFIMAIGTLLAKPKSWDERPGTIRLIITPVILVILAIVLNTAGTWLLNFGLPARIVSALAVYSIGNLILGFAIGHLVLRPLWAPVGALLQGDRIDGAVARARRPGGRIPLWEKLPVVPPVIRERFAEGYRKVTAPVRAPGVHRWLLLILAVVVVLVTALGGLAKYGFAHGYYMPYLNPHPVHK